MSDIWSRAWCETQKIPNFAVKGITPNNELRDAPKHIRSVYSEPTDHDSTCQLSRSPSPDAADTLCFHIRKKKKKLKPLPPTPQPQPVTRKPRHGSEKIASFKAPTNPPNPHHNSGITPPLSPGTVRVRRNISRTPSTVSSGYQYRISTSSTSPPPPPNSAVSSTRTDPHSPRPSRNCAYTPSPSPRIQTEEPVGHTDTYLDQLEEENQKLKNILLLNHIDICGDTSSKYNSNRTLVTNVVTEHIYLDNKACIQDTSMDSDKLQVGEVLPRIQLNRRSKQLDSGQTVESESGCVISKSLINPTPDCRQDINPKIPPRSTIEADITSLDKPNQINPPRNDPRSCDYIPTVPDVVMHIPTQLSHNTLPKSPTNHSSKQAGDSQLTKKLSGYLFVGQNGEVLAESKGSLSDKEVIIKRVTSGVHGAPLAATETVNSEEDGEQNRKQAWQKLKQISLGLERTVGEPADKQIPLQIRNQENKQNGLTASIDHEMYFKFDMSGDEVFKERSGDEVSKERSGDEVSKERSGSKVSRVRSGNEVSKERQHGRQNKPQSHHVHHDHI